MQRKKGHSAGSREAVSPTSVLKSALLALPVMLGVGLLLLAVLTAVLLNTRDPNKYHTAAGLVLLYVSTAVGGAAATRLHARRTPLFCGLATGALVLLLLLLLSLVLPAATSTHTNALHVILHALLIPASLAGALLAAREKKAKKRYRSRG